MNSAARFSFLSRNAVAGLATAVSLLLAGPAPAYGQFSGYYVELSAGPVDGTVEPVPALSDRSQVAETEAESDMVSLAAGLRFNDNVAVELSYSDFGSFSSPAALSDSLYFLVRDMESQESTIVRVDAELDGEAEYEATAFAATLIGSWPLGRWLSVYGKLGLSAWEVESELTGTSISSSGGERFEDRFRLEPSDNGSTFHYGVGLLYRFARSYGIKLEYQEMSIDSDIFSSDLELESLSLGLRFYF